MEGVASEVTEMDDLYLNFPQTKNLAGGVLFGYLAKGEIALQLDVPKNKTERKLFRSHTRKYMQ